MLSVNGGEPTAAKRIRELMTRLVELPELTKRAGESVKVRIRVVSASEFLEATREVPTSTMEADDRKEYLTKLDNRGKRALLGLAEEADDRLVCLAVISPRVSLTPTDDEEAIHVSALRPDRLLLVQQILGFSGLLAAPAAVEEAGVPVESFRVSSGVVGSPVGDGGAMESAPLGTTQPAD